MQPPIVELSGVGKVFRTGAVETPALRAVDLQVADGELLMLVGPSGCGKTTLLSIMAGILGHDSGRVAVLGQDLDGLGDRGRAAFRARHLGFVFQSYNLIPALTVRENVAVPLLIAGLPRREALQRADLLVERVGLAERRLHRPQQLSGGQQQRVAIARALVHEPELVVCDEPTSALDHTTGELILDLLRSVAVRPGRALVIVTHDNRILRFADRIAAMDDGSIVSVAATPHHLALSGAHS